MTDLCIRRQEVADELADMEREQGAALLDGKQYDPSVLVAKRAELTVIAAAEQEGGRRQDAADSLAAAEKRRAARIEARDALAASLAAMKRAERHIAAAAVELRAIAGHSVTLSSVARRLGVNAPIAVDRNEQAKVISRLVGAVLRAPGTPNRYGDMEFPAPMIGQSWKSLATNLTKAFAPIIEGIEE